MSGICSPAGQACVCVDVCDAIPPSPPIAVGIGKTRCEAGRSCVEQSPPAIGVYHRPRLGSARDISLLAVWRAVDSGLLKNNGWRSDVKRPRGLSKIHAPVSSEVDKGPVGGLGPCRSRLTHVIVLVVAGGAWCTWIFCDFLSSLRSSLNPRAGSPLYRKREGAVSVFLLWCCCVLISFGWLFLFVWM